MTKEETKAAAEVMRRAAEGETLEMVARNAAFWNTVPSCEATSWNWDQYRYRIKSSPREFLLDPEMAGFPLAAFPVDGGSPKGRFIKVREVPE